MAGLDAAASITAIISFSVSVFQGCVKGYQLISAASHAEKDLSRIHCFLQWEELRLVEWGRRINIDGDVQNQYLPWHLIRTTLEALQHDLTDLDTLKTRYGLEPASTVNHGADVMEKRKGVARLWAYASPEARDLRARSTTATANQKLGSIQRFRWITLDQQKITALISTLTRFNNQLYDVLEQQQRDFIQDSLQLLLRDLVSRTSYGSDLETVKFLNGSKFSNSTSNSIEAAVDVKQARIDISYDQRHIERPLIGRPKAKVTKLNGDAIVPFGKDGNREIASYKNSKRNVNSWVLLEWKQVSQPKLKRRVESLTILLEKALDPAFHTLRCLGYAADDGDPASAPAYAYAYELIPRNPAQVVDNPPQTCTLRELLTDTQASQTRPSLTTRLRYAQHIAQGVLQLHTAGWLHKSIRPSSILFLMHQGQKDPQGPYIIGFEYSRADGSSEMTEDPTRRPETDIYRHPDLLKPDRSDFCKAFDLYSLGCVLVEIALWRQLDCVPQCMRAENNGSWNVDGSADDLIDEVAFAAGDDFASAVKLCFSPLPGDSDVDNDDSEASVANEMEITRLLTARKY